MARPSPRRIGCGGHGAGGGAERARGRERRLSRPARRAFSARAWHAPRRRRAWPWSRRHSACGRPGAIGRRLSHRQGRAAPRRIAGDRRAGSEHAHQRRAARRRRRADQRRGRDLAGRREQSVHRQRGRRPCHGAGRGFRTAAHRRQRLRDLPVRRGRGGAGERRRDLAAAQRLVYDAAGLQPARALDADDLPAWRDGFLRFRQAPWPGAGRDQPLPFRPRHSDGAIAGRQARQRAGGAARLDTAIAQIRENFQLDATALPGGVLLLG